MNILIIGLGKVGSRIAQNVSKLNYVKEIFSYELGKKKNINSKIKSLRPLQNVKIDYVFITLSRLKKEQRKKLCTKVKNTVELRHHELKCNLQAIKKYLPYFKKMPRSTKFIVLTNPMDEITNFLQFNLPDKQVIGFGSSLDKKRLSTVLKKKIECLGLHGQNIPIINLGSKTDYSAIINKADDQLLRYVKKSGIPVKKTADLFLEFFKTLNSKKEKVLNVCALNKDICISRPFWVKNGKILKPLKINLNKIEEKLFIKQKRLLHSNLSKIVK